MFGMGGGFRGIGLSKPHCCTNKQTSRDLVLVIKHWLVIEEKRVRPQVIPYFNCGGRRDIDIGFSPCTSVSSLNIITPVLFSHIY
jgi:hypothetical protein